MGDRRPRPGYARCQILRAMPSSLSSFVTTTAGAVFHRFFAMTELSFFLLLFFLPLILPFPFCLCTFRGRAEFLFSRKSYGSLASASASASANASAPLILRERAKGGILARSQMFPCEQEEQRELISSSSRV